MLECVQCHQRYEKKPLHCSCGSWAFVEVHDQKTCPRCGHVYTPPRCAHCGRPDAPHRPAPLHQSAADACRIEQLLRIGAEQRYPTTLLYRTDTRLLRELKGDFCGGRGVTFPPAGFHPRSRQDLPVARALLRRQVKDGTLQELLNQKIFGNLSQAIAPKLVSTAPERTRDNPGGQRGTTPLRPWGRYKPVYQIIVPNLRMHRLDRDSARRLLGIQAGQVGDNLKLVLNGPTLDTSTVFGASHGILPTEVTLFTGVPGSSVFLYLDGEDAAGLHHYAEAARWGDRPNDCLLPPSDVAGYA